MALEQSPYFGFAYADDGCDVSYGLSLSFKFLDALELFFFVAFCAFSQVLFFCGVFFEFKVDEGGGFFKFIDYDVISVVKKFSSSDLELLDVAESVIFGRFTYGEDAVEEVV